MPTNSTVVYYDKPDAYKLHIELLASIALPYLRIEYKSRYTTLSESWVAGWHCCTLKKRFNASSPIYCRAGDQDELSCIMGG